MRAIEWINNNKMKFDSLHKGFNDRVQCVGKNTLASGWASMIVRKWNDTAGYNETKAPGHLASFDISCAPNAVKSALLRICKANPDVSFSWIKMSSKSAVWFAIIRNDMNAVVYSDIKNYKQESALYEALTYL